MRKQILFLLLLGALLPQISKAQHLVAEEDLSYLYRYTSEELSSVEEPDSVYAFYEYGNNYEVGYIEDSTQITLDLLKCRNLQVLELHNIQATDVLAHLDQFPYLQILILDNIGLQSLPDGFYALKNLKKLELSNFESLHFDGSKMAENNIHELNLTNSISRNADEEMVDHPLEIFSQLKSLVMSGDGMNIPESLYSLTNLVYLDLSALGLTYISPQIENLVNLESLYLNNNDYLDNLPDEIGNLTSLRYLNLSGCNLEQLPAGIEKLIALESLDLSLNPIAELPEGIGNLEMLYSLNLSGTGMVNLPYSLKNCKSLNTLNM
ncbi:MAG: hypothetical protein IT244_06535, partial [Bacteroidia bacterium]|nr:hypothetical protein [Bacteroidia bacterium]